MPEKNRILWNNIANNIANNNEYQNIDYYDLCNSIILSKLLWIISHTERKIFVTIIL